MKKKINLRKIFPKIAILLALIVMMTMVLSSCGSNNIAIDDSLDLSGLANPKTEEPTTSEEIESGDIESGEVESGEVESGETESKEEEEEEEKETQKPIHVDLEKSKGFLDTFLSWIGTALSWITKGMPANNYILTLMVFAIVMELVFLPVGIKQHKNSIKQAKLKPKEMAIRKRYAGRNDQATQQKVTQEIQELYQKENFNPMAGCLPLLIQLPVLIVLYWVVVNPMKYVLGCSNHFLQVMLAIVKAEGHTVANNGSIQLLNKINELSSAGLLGEEVIAKYCENAAEVSAEITRITQTPLNFRIGSIDLGQIPQWNFWEFGSNAQLWVLLLVPVLTFVVYFFSTKITRKLSFQPTQSADARQEACSNKMMEITMPLMSVFITFGVPAAIGVYWMFKSILGVLKQLILSKAMPLPQFTEEDYKAAEREMFGKQPKKIQKSENAGKARSLHHIDDEDYDEKGNYVPKKVEEKVEEEPTETKQEIPENNMTEGASLKDESDKGERKFNLFKKKNNKE